jgi:hypothetical protein
MGVERLDLEILVNGEQALPDPGYNAALYKFDSAAKSRKKHKNQISGHVISMGYETEIRGF